MRIFDEKESNCRSRSRLTPSVRTFLFLPLSICLSVCPSVCHFIHLSVSLSICLCLSPFLYLFAPPSISLSLYISQSLFLFVYLHTCLSLSLSLSASLLLSINLFLCPFILLKTCSKAQPHSSDEKIEEIRDFYHGKELKFCYSSIWIQIQEIYFERFQRSSRVPRDSNFVILLHRLRST